MNYNKSNLVSFPEKSKNIPILKKKNILIQNDKNEYSQKENFFDPSKQSPPNEFIVKLQQRMNNYSLMTNTLGIKFDNLSKE